MIKRSPRPWEILPLLVLPAACESPEEATPYGLRVTVEDSAGVTIVTNDPPAPDSRLQWRFGAQPSLSIGSVDSGEADQLFRVTDATRLPDGRIVIANSGSNELRVFNADGSHAGTWGGRGEGPGEFTSYQPDSRRTLARRLDRCAQPLGDPLVALRQGRQPRPRRAPRRQPAQRCRPAARREDLHERQRWYPPGDDGILGPCAQQGGLGGPGLGRHAARFAGRFSRQRVLGRLRGGRKHRGRAGPTPSAGAPWEPCGETSSQSGCRTATRSRHSPRMGRWSESSVAAVTWSSRPGPNRMHTSPSASPIGRTSSGPVP